MSWSPIPAAVRSVYVDAAWTSARTRDAALRLSAAGGLLWLDDNLNAERATLACAPVQTLRVRRGVANALRSMKRAQPLWAGYLAYDACWSWEDDGPPPSLGAAQRTTEDRPGFAACFNRYDAWLVVDGQRAELHGVSREAIDALARRLDEGHGPVPSGRVRELRGSDPDAHRRAIRTAKKAIERGDIYQINLARTWRAEFEGSPLALWEGLRNASPVPYGFYLDAEGHQVLGRSMECFLKWTPVDGRGRLETRPIKGTRAGSDASSAQALRSDPKERAEHTMIVDLMRNDLGRVAEVGSVRVEAPLRVEPYRKLSHLVSTVACTTEAGTTLEDILRATFPPGSISGTPKVRAVEQIDALEGTRGVYCGAVGVFSEPMELAVAIRTTVLRGAELDYRAGGGIVSASEVEREVAETELKTAVLRDAIAHTASSAKRKLDRTTDETHK